MNPLPSTAKTQFIKRAQFLAKDSGDTTTPIVTNLTDAANKPIYQPVGGRSSTVESKLVELVVAGSNPVGHPIFISAHTEV